MEADILARRDGLDSAVQRPRLFSKICFFNFPNPSVCWKVKNRHLYQTLTFYYGFTGNRLGKNVHNDRGVISGFHQNSDFDPCFADQSPYFPENLDFCFLCLNTLFLFG